MIHITESAKFLYGYVRLQNIYGITKRIVNTDETFDIEDPQNLEEQFIAGEEKVSLYKKMQNLDEKTREVMYLRITGELSFKEIGEILGKTENWARVTFYRGKSKLKEVDENEKGM